MLGIFSLILIAWLLWILFRPQRNQRTLYLDTNKNNQVFKSQKHRIAGKPDRIEGATNGYVVPHEFKSRNYGFFNRDVIQIKTAAIAIRDSGYKVKEAVLELGSGKKQTVTIEPTIDMLNSEVGELINIVRSIKRGEVPAATPSADSCNRCGYRACCPHSVK